MPSALDRVQTAPEVKRERYCYECKKMLFTLAGSFGTHTKFCGRTEELFWAKVEKGEHCWIFTGCKDKWGYGQHGIKARRIQAHRYSYALANGPIPAGKLIMHSCDNPPCVNPAHLSLGTDAENLADAVAKGRATRITRHKLTEDQVREIRAAYWIRGRVSNSYELAEKYNVGVGAITGVTSGRTWGHIK